MKIPFVSFEKMHDEIKDELTGKFQQVLAKNWFIQGEELAKFEEEYAAYCGVKYCVGVGNGLDALFLPLKAYGIGTGEKSLFHPIPLLQLHWQFLIQVQLRYL